ncbi:hypothetical protein M9Y10_040500 [Tritrichomonas musculus]|uniref:Uncharacterized protein n=1 Tax=Tritrichomonas musculus TaxID=1915356 RepID=A0ABR2GPL2_9EUKA
MSLDNEKFISKLKKSEILLLPGFDASDKKTKLADLKMKLHNNVHYSLKKTGARVKDYIDAYNRRDEIKQQQIESTKKISINKKFERGVYQEINKIKVQARKVYDKFEHNDEEVIEYRNNEDIQKLLKSGEIIDDVYINLNKEYDTIEQSNRITKKTKDEYIKLFKNKFGFKPKVCDIFYLANQKTESVLKDARVDIQRILKYLNADTVPKTVKPKIDKLKTELLNAPDVEKKDEEEKIDDEIDDEFFEAANKRGQQLIDDMYKRMNLTKEQVDKLMKKQQEEKTTDEKPKPKNVIKVSQIKTAKPKDERQKIIDEIVNVRNEAKTKTDKSYGDDFDESVRHTKRYKTQLKDNYITLFKNKFGIKPSKFKHLETDEIDFDDDIDEIMKLKSKPTKTKTTKPKDKSQAKPIDNDSNEPTVEDYVDETQAKNYKKIQKILPYVERDIINDIYHEFLNLSWQRVNRLPFTDSAKDKLLNKSVLEKVYNSTAREPVSTNAIMTCLKMMYDFNNLWRKDKSKVFYCREGYQVAEWIPGKYMNFKIDNSLHKFFDNYNLNDEYNYFMTIPQHDIDTEIKRGIEQQFGYFIDESGKKATLPKSKPKPEPAKPLEPEPPAPEPRVESVDDKPTVEDYVNETQFKNYKQIQQTFPDVDRDIINEIYWSFVQIANLYIDRCSTNESDKKRKLNKLVTKKIEDSPYHEPTTINTILTCLKMMLTFNNFWRKDKSKVFESYQLNEWLPSSYFKFNTAKKFNNTFTNDMLYPEYKYFMSISLHDIDTEIKKSVEKQYGFFIDDLGNKATLDNKTNKSDERLLFESEEQKPKRKPVKRKDTPSVEQEIKHESSVKPEPEPTAEPTKIKSSMILESEPLKKIKMIPTKIVSSIPEQQLEQQLEEKRKKYNLAPPLDNDEDFLKIKQFNYKKLNRKIYSSIDFEIQDVITGAALVCDDKYQKLMRKTKIDNKDRKSEKWKSLFNEIYVDEYEYRFGIKPLKIPKHDIVLNGGLLDTTISYVDKNDIKHVFNHRLNNPIPPHVKHEAEEKAKRDVEEKAKREAEQQRLQDLFTKSKLNELKSSPPPKLKSDFEPVEPPSQLPTIEDKPFEDMESAGSINNSLSQTQQQETYNNFMNPDFDDEFASDEYDYAFDHVI